MAFEISDYVQRNTHTANWRNATADFNDSTPSDWIATQGPITVLVSNGSAYQLSVELSFLESHDDAQEVGTQDESERAANYDAEGLVYWRFTFSGITGGPVNLGLSYRT